MPKKVLIALPPAMLQQVDMVAECEHRTRSDLIREALRRYLADFKRNGSAGNVSTLMPSAQKESYGHSPAMAELASLPVHD